MKLFSLATVFALPINAFAIGAIAVDDERGLSARDVGYGISTGYDTKDEAKREAMKQCKKAGNTGCKIVATFEGCAAYAASKSTYGLGGGETKKAAEADALDNCDHCRIVVSECEDE